MLLRVLIRLRRAGQSTGALVACVTLAAAPLAVRAQTTRAVPAQLPYRQVISASPLAIPFGTFSAEYEAALTPPGVSAAIAGTYNGNTRFAPRRDRWLEGRIMYYPNEVTLQGLAIGLTAGVHHAERKYRETTAVKASDAGATLGLLGTYNFLLGREKRLVFGTGIGVKRVLKNVGGDTNSPLSQVYGDARLLLGFAF